MKLIIALLTCAFCLATAVSRIGRISRHRSRGGPKMKGRIYGSAGVGLASLGWGVAVLVRIGALPRGDVADWVFLLAATVVSAVMMWTLIRSERQQKSRGGKNVAEQQAAAKRRFQRIQAGLDPDLEEDEDSEVSGTPTGPHR